MRLLIIGSLILLFSGTAAAEDVNGIATGSTKVQACANAKAHAERKCDSTKVDSFYECDCETGTFEGGDEHRCSVDATCATDKGSSDDSSNSIEANATSDD